MQPCHPCRNGCIEAVQSQRLDLRRMDTCVPALTTGDGGACRDATATAAKGVSRQNQARAAVLGRTQRRTLPRQRHAVSGLSCVAPPVERIYCSGACVCMLLFRFAIVVVWLLLSLIL